MGKIILSSLISCDFLIVAILFYFAYLFTNNVLSYYFRATTLLVKLTHRRRAGAETTLVCSPEANSLCANAKRNVLPTFRNLRTAGAVR